MVVQFHTKSDTIVAEVTKTPFAYVLSLISATLGLASCTQVRQNIASTPPKTPTSVANGELDPAVVSNIKSAVAFVTDLEGGQPTSAGTGFRCSNPKWIITARHVVTGTDDD